MSLLQFILYIYWLGCAVSFYFSLALWVTDELDNFSEIVGFTFGWFIILVIYIFCSVKNVVKSFMRK